MDQLLSVAKLVASRLIARNETVAVAESSAGGLISTALLAVPGASAYFLGAVNLYTAGARAALLEIDPTLRSATVPYTQIVAKRIRTRLASTWAVAESGVTGPTQNRYGDPVGHCVITVIGPNSHNIIMHTRLADRLANMRAFAHAALTLLANQIGDEI
jgi:PncC family amidohydrolase